MQNHSPSLCSLSSGLKEVPTHAKGCSLLRKSQSSPLLPELCLCRRNKKKHPQLLEVYFQWKRGFSVCFSPEWDMPDGWKSEFPHAAARSAPPHADVPGSVLVLQLACHYGLQLLANAEHCWSLRLPLKADVSTSPPHKWLHPIPADVSVRVASSLGWGRSKVPQFVSLLGNNGASQRQENRFEDDQF